MSPWRQQFSRKTLQIGFFALNVKFEVGCCPCYLVVFLGKVEKSPHNIYMCVCVCVCVCVYIYIYVYMHVCVCMYVCMHAYVYVYV